jgi:purine nucleosidase
MDIAFPTLSPELRAKRLAVPTGRVRAILDSDVANEIDDPFAIALALTAPDHIDLAAITVAPFRREGLTAGQSQDLSLEMARDTLSHLGSDIPLVRGAEAFMDEGRPVESEAVSTLLEYSHDTQDPLVIMAIGACTNVASALALDPGLAERATVWWLGGHGPDFSAWEYNLMGDRAASRLLLNSGIPIVLFPAWGVTSHLLTSLAAMEKEVESSSPLGAYLTHLLREHIPDHYGMEKELWDVAVPAWAVNPAWFRSTVEPAFGVSDDLAWTRRAEGPLWRRITWCSRNEIIKDLWARIAATAPSDGEEAV